MPQQATDTVSIDTRKNVHHRYPARSVTETLTNGFFMIDDKWTVKYWNKSAEKILGVKSDDIVGKNLWEKFADLIPVELYALNRNIFLQDDNPVHFEEYWGEMGSWFDVITYRCENILSVSFKSGTHPNAEYSENPVERLKTLTEFYRFVTEITNDCLWEWDLQLDEIFWIDGGHKRVFGYQVENALIPQSFWEKCIHPEDKIRVLDKLKNVIERYVSTWEDEYRFKKADGSYAVVHDRGHIIYDEKLCPLRMIGASQDVSELILLKNQLNEKIPVIFTPDITSITQPLAIQKKSGIFSSALVHEIRNPLGNISLAAKLLVSESMTEEQKEYIKIIFRSAQRINNLVADFLKDTLKNEELNPGFYVLNQILDEVLVANKDRMLLKHVRVIRNYGFENFKIYVNKQEIKVALMNIITNAIEAMPLQNGELTLVTSAIGDKCILEIKDNGIGINDADLKKIFTRFFTKKAGGIGLGLSSAMNILATNLVTVDVHSIIGSRTVFVLTFNKIVG